MEEIMTGEKFQKSCDIYLGGDIDDFLYNPNIGISQKNLIITDIKTNFNNPKKIFCYGHRVKELYDRLNYFNNEFILISGNSDENIINNEIYNKIANHQKIKIWYAQNLAFEHPKIKLLPIGIANTQWEHGNIKELDRIIKINNNKTEEIYFQFQINTNKNKREICYNKLYNRIKFLDYNRPVKNWERLSKYKFCICPEGNGYDSHRLWECYYLKVVPIVERNDFINILEKQIDLPLIVLEKWEDIFKQELKYENYNFENLRKFEII